VETHPDGFENDIDANDDHSVNLFQPSIAFDKTADTSLSKVGDDVNYTITLDNTSSGDSPDLECTVTDALLGINESVTLASGDQLVIDAGRTVQAGDPDPLVNTAEVTCSPIDFPNVLTATATHTVELFQPALTLVKVCAPASASVGDTITYTFDIANTSSADSPDLVRVDVDDSLMGDVSGSFPASLASGASATINLTRDIASGDSNPLVNTVTALYQVDGFPNQLTVSDECSVTVVAVLPAVLPPTGGLGALADDSSTLILLALIGITLIGGSAWIIWSNRRWNDSHSSRS
jgi:uncharacterized repeat protein (TIGR01451 family)